MHLENRLIAMLDVLGLSNQIKDKANLPAVIDTYKALISEARHAVFQQDTMQGSKNPKAINFEVGEFVFDTIVLISPPLDTKSTCNFVLSTIRLMEIFAKEDMPLRGAIGMGDYCSDTETKIFLSDVFKRLNKEEQNQQWSGCVLLPESEDEIVSHVMGAESKAPTQSNVMHRLIIPSKSSTEEIRWCLNWGYQLSSPERSKLLEYMCGDTTKQKGTADYIEHINSLPDDAQILPPDFYPAVKLKIIKTRSSMQVRFEDKSGIPVDPGCKQWSLQVVEQV